MDYLSNFDENIRKILDKNLDINVNDYKKQYPEDDEFVNNLKNRLENFKINYSLKLNYDKVRINTICLANISLDAYSDSYSIDNLKYDSELELELELELDFFKYIKRNLNLNKKDVVLIYLNIILHDDVNAFKFMNFYFPYECYHNVEIMTLDEQQWEWQNSYRYTSSAHCFTFSQKITRYILRHLDIPVYNVISKILYEDMYHVFFTSITDYINTNFNEDDKYSLYYLAPRNVSIKNTIMNINNIDIINKIILISTRNKDVWFLKDIFNNKVLLHPYYAYNDILDEIIEMFNPICNELHKSDKIKIIMIWKILYPNIKKYMNHPYNSYHFFNDRINNLFAFSHSKAIIKLLKDDIEHLKLGDYIDTSNFTPVMDCIKYSSFESVKYVFKNINFEIYKTSINMLVCAFHNKDTRVAKYVIDFLSEKIDIEELCENYDITDYINAINCDNNSGSQRRILKKIEMLHDIYTNKNVLITRIIEEFINSKQLIMVLVKKYNYKFTFCKTMKRLVNKNEQDYIKFIIDNTDFSSYRFKYGLFILFIVNSLKLNYIISTFKYAFKNHKIKKTDVNSANIRDLTLNVLTYSDNCNENETDYKFVEYIEFLRKEIIDDDKIISISNIYSLKSIKQYIEVLYKNGFHLICGAHRNCLSNYYNTNYNYQLYINGLNNIPVMKMFKLVLNKRYCKKKRFDEYVEFYNWEIVTNVMKNFIKKRYKKNREVFKENINLVNFEFNFSNIESDLHIKPKHIKPSDFYKDINETHLWITQKADGVFKRGLYGEKGAMLKTEFNIDIDNIEYEKTDDIMFIFNYNNDPSIVNKLRYINKYITKKEYESLNLSNWKEILTDYFKTEKKDLERYKLDKSIVKKIWAKYNFRISKMSKEDYIKLISNICNFQQQYLDSNLDSNLDSGIPDDGWILVDNDYLDILKIKPREQLTIDLVYKNNCLLDLDRNKYNFTKTVNLKENKIYRCYYNQEKDCWNPREERFDKFKPNNSEICRYLEKYNKYYWEISEIKMFDKYYQKKTNIKHLANKDNSYLDFIQNGNILNLGCGFQKLKLNPDIKCNIVGIDIDPSVINKCDEKYIGDLSKTWGIKEQLESYGNVYYHIPNLGDFNDKFKEKPFSSILSINSIHYMLNSHLLENINKFTCTGSQFIIKFLDKSLLNKILDSYISWNSSFVRKISDDKIKIYYDWCHNSPIEEKVYSRAEIEAIFNKYGWQTSFFKAETKLDKWETDWEKYFKCFSTIVFIRK